MFAANCNAVFNGWSGQMLTRFNKMFYLAEYPRIANSSTANHYSIYAVTVFIFNCFFSRVNIAITKNGYFNARVIFYFANQCPVGFTFVHLCAGAAMNSQCLYAYILQ